MMPHRKATWFNEFTVFGVFIAVSLVGLLYGGFSVLTQSSEKGSELFTGQQGPSADEYRASAREILTPFIDQTKTIKEADVVAAGPILRELAQKTQDRLLRLRVPSEMRDAHLSFVLLLDKWKRALDGSPADQAAVVERTKETVEENGWLYN